MYNLLLSKITLPRSRDKVCYKELTKISNKLDENAKFPYGFHIKYMVYIYLNINISIIYISIEYIPQSALLPHWQPLKPKVSFYGHHNSFHKLQIKNYKSKCRILHTLLLVILKTSPSFFKYKIKKVTICSVLHILLLLLARSMPFYFQIKILKLHNI